MEKPILLKEELIKNFDRIREREYVGDAGAGMIKVIVKADMTVTKVEIDHTMFAKTAPEMLNDLDFLADLFKAATNQAIRRGNEGIAEAININLG